jgi:hypothetical protein
MIARVSSQDQRGVGRLEECVDLVPVAGIVVRLPVAASMAAVKRRCSSRVVPSMSGTRLKWPVLNAFCGLRGSMPPPVVGPDPRPSSDHLASSSTGLARRQTAAVRTHVDDSYVDFGLARLLDRIDGLLPGNRSHQTADPAG